MRTKTRKMVVRGIEVKTTTPRALAVVAVRPEPVHTEDGTYVAFAEVIKRTDAHATARATARRFGRHHGAFAVVVDIETGEEVSA